MLITVDMKLCLILLVCVHVINGDQRAFLQEPPEMKSLDINKYLGRWYTMESFHPCSWQGSSDFTDWSNEFYQDKETGKVGACDVYRNQGTCLRLPLQLTMTGRASYKLKDFIGDVSSGKVVIVATDYKSFAISWGCTRVSAYGNKCLDSWIDLDTREPLVTKRIRQITDRIFSKVWGVTTNKLTKVPHSKPC